MLPLAIPAIQAGVGIIQGILGGSRAHKAQNALENLQTPTYQKSQSIQDYYNKALQRYNINPYQTNAYQQQQRNIQRGTATGIGALQDRRSAVGGITKLIQAQNDASLNAGTAAERQQSQAFGQLGQASTMQQGEDRMAFQVNQMMPYEKKYNLLTAKASGGNQMANAGMSNIFGALGTAGQMQSNDYLMKNYYGGNSGSSYTDQDRYIPPSTYKPRLARV